MPSHTLPDLTLHYLDVNAGAPRTVLLLHGLGVTGGSWRLQIPALAAVGYRVLAPDLRGFGRSSYPGRTGIADMAQDAAELIRAQGNGPVDVVGISMGGTVALRLAVDHADVVDRLVLVNTTARLRPHNPAGWLMYALRYAALYAMGFTAQANLVARRTFPHPHQAELRRVLVEQIMQANPYAYRASLRALGFFDIHPRLREIQAPTLVVSSARDSAIPLRHQQPLADGIAQARHVIIPDAGHGVIAEHADVFNRVLLDFLGGCLQTA
jgi:pimeloyl-ACP methyl ester carboxylesterase